MSLYHPHAGDSFYLRGGACTCGKPFWSVVPPTCPIHEPNYRWLQLMGAGTVSIRQTSGTEILSPEPNRAIRADDV